MTAAFRLLIGLLAVVLPQSVMAHAGEQGFVLLLPTGIYAAAGTAAVVASMILVTCTPNALLDRLFRPVTIWSISFDKAQMVTSILSSFAFFGLIYIGFFGAHDPQENLLPLFIWTGFWVALYVIQGVVFDIWQWVNPWRGLYMALLRNKVAPFQMKADGPVWPALGGYALFNLFLMADIAPADPERLAMIAVLYWCFTFCAMILFGGEAWLARGECFSVLLRLIGALRPVVKGQIGGPGWAAISKAPPSLSEAIFCLVILASGSFDGIRETFWWLGQIDINPLEFPGRSAVVWQSSLGLVATNVALLATFAASLWIGARLVQRYGAGDKIALGALFAVFSLSILPIALGYHFAHYFVGFLVQCQYLSIAFFELFEHDHGAHEHVMRVTTGFLFHPPTVKLIFLTQAGVVVGSHILAVLMAHHLSARFVQTWRDKLLLQSGLSVLMVAYTIFGLWLLASPRGA